MKSLSATELLKALEKKRLAAEKYLAQQREEEYAVQQRILNAEYYLESKKLKRQKAIANVAWFVISLLAAVGAFIILIIVVTNHCA